MAIPREKAFGVFDDLLNEGLRPVITGFRVVNENEPSSYWPLGSEGYFVYAHFNSHERLGALVERFQQFQTIADRHGLKAWFTGREHEIEGGEGPGYPEYRVSFESGPSTRTRTGAQQ